MRRPIAMFVSLVLALLAVAACSQSPEAAVALTVRITDLPGGRSGNVVVSGRNGYTARLTRTTTLRVARGQYSVRAAGVPVGTVTYYPQHLASKTAAPGTAVVDYAEQVPHTTKILDAADPGFVPGTSATGLVLAFVPATPGAGVRPGDVLVIPPGPQRPHTLIRKVTSVTPGASRVLVRVVPGELRDAVPRGALHVRLFVDPSAGVGLGSTSCGGGANFDGSASASVDGWIDFDIAWGWVTPNYIKLVGGISEKASVSLAVRETGYCEETADSPGIELPSFPIDLGPFVLMVDPELVAHGEVKGSLAKTRGFGFEETGWAKAGFTWGTPDGSNQDLHPIAGVGASFTTTHPDPSPAFNVSAGAGPQVNFNIDGFGIDQIKAGPYVNMLGGLTVGTNPLSANTYRLSLSSSGTVNVGIRAQWGPLNVNISQDFPIYSAIQWQHVFSENSGTPTPTGGCVVNAPGAVSIDMSHELPGSVLTLARATPNDNGPLTQVPSNGPGGDGPGSAAVCQWVGAAVTPKPPYYFPFTLNTNVSIVPFATTALARRAWDVSPQPPITGWPNPAGIGDAARWDSPGPQDGNALLEILKGRFLCAIAVTEAGPLLAQHAEIFARRLAGQLPSS